MVKSLLVIKADLTYSGAINVVLQRKFKEAHEDCDSGMTSFISIQGFSQDSVSGRPVTNIGPKAPSC